MSDSRDVRNWNDVGGTSGGLGSFLVGLFMTVGGAWLITNQVTVTSGFWYFGGHNAFGLSLIPLLLGVAMLFYNGRSVGGWLLTGAGLVIIFAGILSNLNIYFRPTSLFNTVLMFVLLFGGIGLLARSLRPQRPRR